MSSEDLWGVVDDPNAGKAPLAVRVVRDGKVLRTVRLEPNVTYIGRMPENHIVLDDPKASRSHARIIAHGHQFVIEDQESENGIFFKKKKVRNHILSVGDHIEVAGHILEVIPASAEAKETIRESQLEEAEQQEWRLDQTVSISSDEVQRRHLARVQTKKEPSKAVMKVTLEVGGRTVEKEIVFETGKKREAKAPNQLEVRLSLGQWVLEKKIPL